MPGRRTALRRLSLAAALLACGLATPRAHAQFTTGAVAQQQTMPSVTGMSENEASGLLRQRGMQVEVRQMESSRPRGTVVRQQPAAGTAIKQGALAVIGVSSGPPSTNADTTTPANGGQTQPSGGGRGGIDVGIQVRPPRPGLVPNVVGMTLPAARARLIASMLRPGRVDSAFVEGAEPGRVVAQSLAPGSQVLPGRGVRLTVQQRAPVAQQPPAESPRTPTPTPVPPRRPARVAVPNLGGRTVAEARTLVGGARLLLGGVDSAAASSGRPGTVTAQRPAAGDSVEPGTLVRITIAQAQPRPQEPATAEVPNLVGRTPAEARRMLTQAGLSAGTVTQRDAEGRPHVLGQSIPAGTRVLRTTQVGFVVSRTPVVVRPDTPRTPAGAPVVDSVGQPPQSGQPAQPQTATPAESASSQPPVVAQPPVAPATAPATTPQVGTGARTPTGTGQERQDPPVPIPWRWIAIAVAALVAAGGLYLRFRSRPGPAPEPAAKPAPVPASPLGVVVTVRARGGGSTAGGQPERPVEKGRVKIGMVVGPPRTPEPAAGAAALHPGQVIVRLVDDENDDPLGAHPQRVIDGGEIRVRVAGAEPALTADLEAGILKGS